MFLEIELELSSEKAAVAAMEASLEKKVHKQQVFPLASIAELASSFSVSSSSSSIFARFSADSGIPELRFDQESASVVILNVDLRVAQVSSLFFFFFFRSD